MSFAFINDFQNQIFKTLSTDNYISSTVNKIYFGAVQDGRCPFLLINVQQAQEISFHVNQIYSIEFEVLAYAKDHNHKLLLSLADRVIENLSDFKILFNGFRIAGMKANKISFEKAKDLVLNKLSISYKALVIKERDE